MISDDAGEDADDFDAIDDTESDDDIDLAVLPDWPPRCIQPLPFGNPSRSGGRVVVTLTNEAQAIVDTWAIPGRSLLRLGSESADGS